MAPVVTVVTLGWLIAGAVLWATDAPSEQRWTSLAGILVGLVLLPVMALRDRRTGRGQVSRGRTAPAPPRRPPNPA